MPTKTKPKSQPLTSTLVEQWRTRTISKDDTLLLCQRVVDLGITLLLPYDLRCRCEQLIQEKKIAMPTSPYRAKDEVLAEKNDPFGANSLVDGHCEEEEEEETCDLFDDDYDEDEHSEDEGDCDPF